MPTEAEWEYTCRSGRREYKKYHFNDEITSKLANFNRNIGHTCKVRSYAPNDFGLYDMHGNVWEWRHDCKGPYNKKDRKNPKGLNNGTLRVLRGGSWYYYGHFCRAACRNGDAPDNRDNSVGFRVCCAPGP